MLVLYSEQQIPNTHILHVKHQSKIQNTQPQQQTTTTKTEERQIVQE